MVRVVSNPRDPRDPRGWAGARTSLTFWWVLCYGGRYYG